MIARIGRFALYTVTAISLYLPTPSLDAAERSRFAHSDSDARFIHHINLYDAKNRRITAESTEPYSTSKTCGRCHDYDTISHGWHFNAFFTDTEDGRAGEPWIWTDDRTGTQLPLSYRDWEQGYDPRKLGLSSFEMTRHFGARIPGGGLGVAPAVENATENPTSDESANGEDSADEPAQVPSRWELTGSLEVDCMVCHAVSGAYDFNNRREQIEHENFAWAPTAGLRLGSIEGDVSRIRDGAAADDPATQEKLPQVTYDARRFAPDGTVFMDLVRKPPSNSCYQCHSNRHVDASGIQQRWVHDDDVHLRAGMSCVDCHRNGIDHHIVRGFSGEENPSGQSVVTLSCAGCHLGADTGQESNVDDLQLTRSGRLGAPLPLHAGLPAVHFEKMTCTACHAGPLPRKEALGVLTSLAHGLGSKATRDGTELPRIASPVYMKNESGKVAPHRATWPAFWAIIEDGKAKPVSPSETFDLTRRSLRVRQSFVNEILKPRTSRTELKKLLGDDRAAVNEEEWTEEERQKVADAQTAAGQLAFQEKVFAALETLEEELDQSPAAYVSSGMVYVRGEREGTLQTIDLDDTTATGMLTWPIGHRVRPAGWSLGANGCVECHEDDGLIFSSTVSALGPAPDIGEPITMASLQGVDPDQRLTWNQLFTGRKRFKYILGISIAVLVTALLISLGAFASRMMPRRRNADR